MLSVDVQHLMLTALVAFLGVAQTALHNRNAADIRRLQSDLSECRENIHELRSLLYKRADITNRNIT
jgi:hypothetical protein